MKWPDETTHCVDGDFVVRIKCTNIQILDSGRESFRAKADLELTEAGIVFRDCMVTEDSVVQWFDLLSSSPSAKTALLAQFTDPKKHALFTRAAIKAAKGARDAQARRPEAL